MASLHEGIRFLRLDGVDDLLEQSYRLRYQVYGVEKGFMACDGFAQPRECDRYDQWASHFGAIDADGCMVGTVRMVVPPDGQFPLLDHCVLEGQPQLAGFKTAEISRLAIGKQCLQRRTKTLFGIPLGSERESLRLRQKLVMGLYRAVYQESKRQGIDYWLAAMERSLQRLLGRNRFFFRPIGPEVDYHGPVMPYLACVEEVECAVRSHRPSLFEAFKLSRHLD